MTLCHTVTPVTMTQRTTSPEPEYLTPAEAAARLRISPRTLWRYQSDGRITPVTLPSGHRRFRRADIEALLAVGK